MDSGSVGLFDSPAVHQSCWQTCDTDPGAYAMDLTAVPFYHDDATRAQFYDVATFFGCVQHCEGDFRRKRVLFLAPPLVAGFLLAVLVLCCCFCRCCPVYLWRRARAKKRLAAAPASSASASAVLIAEMMHPDAAQKAALVEDLGASLRSGVSVNSWTHEPKREADTVVERGRSAFLQTASRLGNRLVELDRRAEEDRRRRLRRRAAAHASKATAAAKASVASLDVLDTDGSVVSEGGVAKKIKRKKKTVRIEAEANPNQKF